MKKPDGLGIALVSLSFIALGIALVSFLIGGKWGLFIFGIGLGALYGIAFTQALYERYVAKRLLAGKVRFKEKATGRKGIFVKEYQD